MRLKAAPKMGATASAPTQRFLPHKMAAQFCGDPDLFTPRTHLVRPWGPRTPALICGERIALYLVPLARSRYCASPEASIMRLKAAPSLGTTASAPTSAALQL